MNTMTVRDKTYCQVEPAIWEQCPQVSVLAAASGGSGEVLIILALAAVAAALAVMPAYCQRLGEIERDTEIIKGALD
jgi:hypothetical protein